MAFKPGTDDIRESPALPVLEMLIREGARVTVFDPIATAALQSAYKDQPIAYASELDEAVRSADVIVLMTRWSEFNELPRLVANRQPQPLVVDGRRMLDRASIGRYEGIGLRMQGSREVRSKK